MADSTATSRKFKFIDETKVPYFVNRLLFPNERIAFCVKAIRDTVVVTDKRLLIMNKQYASGKSVEYVTYMYKHIISYSISTPGLVIDFDVDVVLHFINGDTLTMEFSKGGGLEKYIFLIYDLISGVVDGHTLRPGVLNMSMSADDWNEEFFE